MVYERIRDLRTDYNYTQTQLAEYLHVSQRAYSSYENGKRGIPLEILSKLADFYCTSTDYLLNRTDQPNAYPCSKLYKK
ncbi:MAG: helix-turn-helix domain-containing protein [Roseburia sp.]|nr:helix-turn-helix domain-containing protein [Roseburia sp.]